MTVNELVKMNLESLVVVHGCEVTFKKSPNDPVRVRIEAKRGSLIFFSESTWEPIRINRALDTIIDKIVKLT